MSREYFQVYQFAVVICRHPVLKKWLAVKEIQNQGWWLPAGMVDPGEDFQTAALRETMEEAGVDVNLMGVLRVEYSLIGKNTSRMRVIYFAEPKDLNQKPKDWSDKESDEARWVTLQDLEQFSKQSPGLRGYELVEWAMYLEGGGLIYPLSFFSKEGEEIIDFKTGKITREQQPFTIQQLDQQAVPRSSVQQEFTLKTLLDGILNGRADIVEQCIRQGVDINERINVKKWTPLQFAVRNKQDQCVTILLQANADLNLLTHVGRSVMHMAAQSNPFICNICIEKCKETNQLYLINQQDFEGETPLHWAARNSQKGNLITFRCILVVTCSSWR